MSLDGLSTLSVIQAFLAEDMLPVVPKESASELRAAVKLLGAVRIELAGRHHSVLAETNDMINYCRHVAELSNLAEDARAVVSLAGRLAADPSGAALDELWADARKLTTILLGRLQRQALEAPTAADRRAAGSLLRRFCACLTDHARARLHWQSVFPVPSPQPGDTTGEGI